MKGKKGGWYFEAYLIVVILIVLSTAFAVIYVKTDLSKKFGDLPKTVLETYHDGEKILFYVDYSAKHSIYQATYELGQKGGFYELDCGDYLGYSLWQDCYPNRNSLKNNFSLYLDEYIDIYFLQYPEEEIIIPLDNYDFLIKDDKIVGIATENIELDVYDTASLGKYSIKPSFNQKLDFDIFEDYDIIIPKAKQLKSSCKSAEDIERCINDNKNIFDTDNLESSNNCETELKKAFTNFAEEVYLCFNSEDSGCICKFNTLDADYDSVYIEKNKVKMIEDNEDLFEYNLNVDYEDSSNFKPDREVILLKVNNKLSEYGEEDLLSCKTKRNTFRFCIESNKQVYAYSEEDRETKLRNVQYRFALRFE